MRLLRFIGRGLHNVIATMLALVLIGGTITFAANYLLTQGSGTTFGSLVIGGVNYAQHLLCDATTPSQCSAVSNTGQVSVAINGGSAINANGQQNMANSSPVTLANNQSVGDPCAFQTKTNAAFSTTPNNANVALVTGVSAKKIYVCAFSVIASAATAISLTEGSSSTCGTSNQAAVMGVASNGTLANGLSLAANGGLTLGSGEGTVANTATAADYLCIASSSASANVAGNLTYVQQ